MKYFDWNNLDKSILDSKELDICKQYVAIQIRDLLLDPEYIIKLYNYEQEWLSNWYKLSIDDQINEINKIGWALLSHIRNPARISLYDNSTIEEIKIEYDNYNKLVEYNKNNPNTIYKYAWYRHCHDIVPFIFTICKLMYPTREFAILTDEYHSYVMQIGDNETIYDILYNFFDISPDVIYDRIGNAKIYYSIEDFLSKNILY